MKKAYEIKKEELICKINKSIKEFEKQTDTYLTKLSIKPNNHVSLSPDCWGWKIEKRSFLYEIRSTMDTNEIEEIEGNLYSKDYKGL